MCQRAGGESLLVHRGPCHADLKSQMRSHLGKNGEPSLSTRTATFLHMQWKPGESWILVRQRRRGAVPRRKTWRERKLLLPAATHQHITPVTSYTPHFIWNAVARQELNGIADAFLHVCWLLHHMLCFLICSRKSTSWENRLAGAKIGRRNTYRHSSLPYLSSRGSWHTADLCDSSWWGEKRQGSEVTKHNWAIMG